MDGENKCEEIKEIWHKIDKLVREGKGCLREGSGGGR